MVPPSAASRMASISLPLRILGGGFTPMAPAIAWRSSRSLPSSIERSRSRVLIRSRLLLRSVGGGPGGPRAEKGPGDGRHVGDDNRGTGLVAGQAKTWGPRRNSGAHAGQVDRAGFRASAGVLPHRGERRNAPQYTGPAAARQPTPVNGVRDAPSRLVFGGGPAVASGTEPTNRRTGAVLREEASHQGMGGYGVAVGDAGLGVAAPVAGDGVVEEQVRDRVGDMGAEGARRGVVREQQDPVGLTIERGAQRPDDLGVPVFERGHLLADVALVAGLVSGLDVQQEERMVGERVETRRGLRRVVVVEAGCRPGDVEDLQSGEDPESAYEVHRRAEPAGDTEPVGE